MYQSPDFRPVVLAVDDCHITQSLIKKILGQQYLVLFADNGLEALAALHDQAVSVMLLDVQMPGIDGLVLCRAIRNMPQFADLPIIMLTARDHNFDKVQGKLAGATEYLTKPFKPEDLLDVVALYTSQTATTQPSPIKEMSLCD